MAVLPKSDLIDTRDDPIRELVTLERTRRLAQDEAVGGVIDSLNVFRRTHGLLGDESSVGRRVLPAGHAEEMAGAVPSGHVHGR